jgi:hypothetical protein
MFLNWPKTMVHVGEPRRIRCAAGEKELDTEQRLDELKVRRCEERRS